MTRRWYAMNAASRRFKPPAQTNPIARAYSFHAVSAVRKLVQSRLDPKAMAMCLEKASRSMGLPNSADPSMVESLTPCYKPAITCGLQANAFALQGVHWSNDNEMPRLDGRLGSLEQMDEPPPVEDFIRVLQKCREQKSLGYSKRVHIHFCDHGLESCSFLADYLIPMFVECRSISDAYRVFNSLVPQSECCWTSLIRGHIDCQDLQYAFTLYKKMQERSVCPSKYTFMALVKACSRVKQVHKGLEVHAQIAKEGFERDFVLGSTLVDMYVKIGLLAEAQNVFDQLLVRNSLAWTALIAGYAEHGLAEEAFTCLKLMQLDGVSPNTFSFICSLKAHGRLGTIDWVQKIHAEICMEACEQDLFVGSALLNIYAKCGSFAEAQEVFEQLPVRDVVSWNALIAGYNEHGLAAEVLKCSEQMKLEGLSLNSITFVFCLKACGTIGAGKRGQEIHTEITQEGFEQDPFVGSSLVDMYVKCASLAEAREVFDELSSRNVVSWTTLIAGYAEQGLSEELLNCLEWMKLEGVVPDAVTFACSLKACVKGGCLDWVKELHNEITKEGYNTNLLVGSALVDMYAKHGLFAEAWEIFRELPVQDVALWNTLIAGYVEHGVGVEALNCLEQMRLEGLSPDAVTFACILKACVGMGHIVKGQEIHVEVAKEGFDRHCLVGNTLVDMYAKFGLLTVAKEVFDELPVQDVILWNTLMAGYAAFGFCEEVLTCLEQMQVEGISPNAITFACNLKACSSLGAIDRGQELHAELAKEDFETDPYAGNALVDMYAKSGLFAEAWEVLEVLPFQDMIPWNALIAGYAEQGLVEESLNCIFQMYQEGVSPDPISWTTVIFAYAEKGENEKVVNLYNQMLEQGFQPNSVTFVSILKASGTTAALESGKRVHAQVHNVGQANAEGIIPTALVDMYGKCGSMLHAQQLFDAMPTRDLVTWNALITGYACQGQSEHVFKLLERMSEEGIQPDSIIFLSVLNVCSHSGLVDKGEKLFQAMSKEYNITSNIKHQNIMVDLLGRAGRLDEVVGIIEKMPCKPDLVTWSSFLGACQKWDNLELCRDAFERGIRLDDNYNTAFISMYNIYTMENSMWGDAEVTDRMSGEIRTRGTVTSCIDIRSMHRMVEDR